MDKVVPSLSLSLSLALSLSLFLKENAEHALLLLWCAADVINNSAHR